MQGKEHCTRKEMACMIKQVFPITNILCPGTTYLISGQSFIMTEKQSRRTYILLRKTVFYYAN